MTRILTILGILFLFGSAFSVRAQNHNTAVLRASTVVAADRAGEPIAPLLESLKKYVRTHTGSSVVLSLPGSYSRALSAAQASGQPTATGALYAEAQAACAGKADSVRQAKCVQEFVSARLVTTPEQPTVLPPNPEDYVIRLKAPAIAPDLATLLWFVAFASALTALGLFLRNKRRML